MIAKTLFASIAIMLMIAFAHADYDVEKYCQLVQPGTKLAGMDSCETFYVCQQFNKPIQSTCDAGTVFSKNNQGCVPQSDSDCIYGLSNPCQNKNNQFAPSVKGCNWYNWCVNGAIKGDGTCNIGDRFNAANGTCVSGSCGDSNENGDVLNLCDIMPDGQFFGDFTSCSDWYKCKNMDLQKGSCLNSLVFDVTKSMCLANDGNMCQRTNNVVKSQASGPPKEACTNVDQIVGDTNVCSIYYTCRRASNNPNNVYEWVELNCDNQYFDVISKQCTSTSLARPYPGCDRCQFKSGNPCWANDVNPSCSQYLTCNNGQKSAIGTRSCGLGNFFDETSQVCVTGSYTLNQYAINHGACQDYNCDDGRVCSLTEATNTSTVEPSTDEPVTKPEEPKPTEPKPTEPKPTEPKPEEPKPTEPKPEEPKPTEPKPEEPKPTEPKPEEPKPTEPKPEEPKPTEPKPEEGAQ